jgi:pimeloyl-ACP methyl ester carboxylesterase
MQTAPPPIANDSIPGEYWNWRGYPIYYVKAGERRDRPPLLLVHGFGASTDHWRKNLLGLQDDFEVWAIDLLGFGRSAKADCDYSANLWRDQLHDFITEVIGRPAVIAGNSIGAYSALNTTATYPESALGAILLNSAGRFVDAEPAGQTFLGGIISALFSQDWFSGLIFLYSRQKSTIRNTLKKVYLDQSAVTERLVDEIYRPACDPGADRVFALIFRAAKGDSLEVLLKKLDRPLLLLWGEGDPWVKARSRSAEFRARYDRITESFVNAGHCPHDELPSRSIRSCEIGC